MWWNHAAPRCVQSHVDPVIEYVFGVGDGHTTTWRGVADADPDGDGTDEAIWLDFDGDSHRDDLLWDCDGDGIAEIAALDLDDDGVVDHFYSDSGNGVWGVAAARPDSLPAGPEPPETDAPDPPTPHPSPLSPTTAAPAQTTLDSLDLDGDGIAEYELTLEPGGVRRLYIDDDADGVPDRVLVDTDGDGIADATYDDAAPEFGR